MTKRKGLAVVTGASSGIGLELARCCAADGYDLIIAADEPEIEDVATELRDQGVIADLAVPEGVADLLGTIGIREMDLLLANAGHGLGQAFLDQEFLEARHVIDTNVVGTLELIHNVGRSMRSRGKGRILITGSIAGFIPGSFQAVYNGSKAFIDSFAHALRNELKDSGVTVTCLMPGATDTEFFERAGLMDTKIGQSDKDNPAKVAKVGYDAMQQGEGQVITGLKNKLQVAAAHLTPAAVLAEQHRKDTEPGSAHK
jgi:short-subunit dehydrogenase